MKRYILFLAIFLITIDLEGQEVNQLNKMINECLYSFLDKKKNDFALAEDYFANLFLSLDYYPRNFTFSEQIQSLDLKYLSLNTNSYYQVLKKGKKYNFIFLDLSLNNDEISITFSDRIVMLPKKNEINIAVSDFCTFTYKYSCEEKNWIFITAKYGGV
jgi:hypothetical protein